MFLKIKHFSLDSDSVIQIYWNTLKIAQYLEIKMEMILPVSVCGNGFSILVYFKE